MSSSLENGHQLEIETVEHEPYRSKKTELKSVALKDILLEGHLSEGRF